jgi:hypothetical protein
MFGIPVNLRGLPWNEKFVNTLETKAYAAFGDVIWHVNDKLNLTVGLRYTRDEKDFTWFNDLRSAPELDAQLDLLESLGFFDAIGVPKDQFVFDIAFIDPPAVMNKGTLTRDSQSWDDWSPRFVADYHFQDNLMGFASLAKGYKAGGFNALQIGSEFDNEDVWNFETGIKHSLPDYRLSYGASAFYYVYDNRQAVTLDMSTEYPALRRRHLRPGSLGRRLRRPLAGTDGLGFDFNAEYLDSTYKNYSNPQGIDLSGQATGSPYWSLAAGVNYVWRLANSSDVRFSLRHSYIGECRRNSESDVQLSCGVNPALDVGEAQNLTDARIAWTSPTGRWGWALYGNNLFDNQYVNSLGTYGMTVLGTVGARVTQPQTYGVEAQRAVLMRVACACRMRLARAFPTEGLHFPDPGEVRAGVFFWSPIPACCSDADAQGRGTVDLQPLPITTLPGVGPRVAEKLAARGLLTLQDLWLQLPRQYEDRTAITPIRLLQPGVAAQLEGRVEAVERGFRYRPMLRVAIGDDSHGTLVLRFFHFRAAQVAQFDRECACAATARRDRASTAWRSCIPAIACSTTRPMRRWARAWIRSIRRSRASVRRRCGA